MRRVAGRMGETARRLRRRSAARPVVLIYHRVADLAADPQLLAVHPDRFAEHLQILRNEFLVSSLGDLRSALDTGRFEPGTVVVTIDDGYADTFTHAVPLLERHAVPATVFITTGYVGRRREFWWDELERLVLESDVLPRTLSVPANGATQQWSLGEPSDRTADVPARYRSWHVEQGHDPSERHRVYRALYELLLPLPHRARWRLLDAVREQIGTAARVRETHRLLTNDELALLARRPAIDIGAHTVTHPALARLPLSAQREEISRSRDALSNAIGRPVLSFAYPHGSYAAETVSAVRSAGFAYACTSDAHLVRRDTDPFRIPRIVPRNWTGDEFVRWLHGWLA